MRTIKKLFRKLGFLTFFLNIYFAYAQIDKSVEKLDPALDEIVDKDAKVEKLPGDFMFAEGPVWHKDGYLLFTDIPKNSIMKYTEEGKVTLYKTPTGNANGLAFDNGGNLIAAEHSGRRISQTNSKGESSTIVDNYNGKKFNSPNDVVIKSDGSYYFTDPPYGLPEGDDDPTKEIKFSGVYRFNKNKTELLDSTLSHPNGLVFSPDEKYLYVANSQDPPKWVRYEVQKDGLVKKPRLFFNPQGLTQPGGPDGMKVDVKGNLYCTGPSGILIISAKGKHLGTITFPEIPSNCAFGSADMKTLYVTARTGLYRIRLKIQGQK